MAFQILTLSGGGYLGLYSAAVLAALEERSERPLWECFDLIAGTSVGGILALGLASGKPAREIRDAFLEHGDQIFSNKPPPQTELAGRLALRKNCFHAKYRQEPLRRVIEKVVSADALMGSLKTRVIIPAVNLTKGQPQVFKTAHHPNFDRDWRLLIADVALATSAAPTYFPIHRIGGEMFADGGLYANSPDQLALHEAEHFLEQRRPDLRMLSIGTTTAKFSFSNASGTDLGWAGWMSGERLTSAMISSQQLNVDAIMRHSLGDRYLRIDHEQSKAQERQLALDVATEAAKMDLLALAEASVRQHVVSPALRDMLAHAAPAPAFFHHR